MHFLSPSYTRKSVRHSKMFVHYSFNSILLVFILGWIEIIIIIKLLGKKIMCALGSTFIW